MGIETDESHVAADEVICAAGPWNLKLAEQVGIEIPVGHTLAPALNVRLERPLKYMLPSIEPHEEPFTFYKKDPNAMLLVYSPGGYDAGTIYEPDEMGETVPEEIRIDALEGLVRFVPSLGDAEVVDEWVGIRSVTPDGNPIVGWTELDGFSIAAFNTSGIQLSPAVEYMIAEQLIDKNPISYYDALSISRFDGYANISPVTDSEESSELSN